MRTAWVFGWLFTAWCGSATAAGPSGEDLYLGRAPANAQLRGDQQRLPATAVACVNCHDSAASGASFAPRLDAGLLQAVSRRGGPPSAFDEASFCHVLRTGIDPAMVLVRRTMPLFHLTDAECASLWLYVSQRPASAQAVR